MTGGGSGPLLHGGAAGLEVGQLLLPASVAGAASMPVEGRRTDRLFLTRHPEVAGMFAALSGPTGQDPRAGGGWVYEVEPLGQVEPDPWGDGDWLTALLLHGRMGAECDGAWMTTAGRVVAVRARGLAATEDQRAEAVEVSRFVAGLGQLRTFDPARYRWTMEKADHLNSLGMDLRLALEAASKAAPRTASVPPMW